MICLIKQVLETARHHCIAKRIKKVVLISDGVCVIEEAAKLDWGGAELSGVLQTGSAHYNIKRIVRPMPLVDIAYSAAKAKLETPYIVKTALASMQSSIEHFKVEKIGVVGAGNVGKEILSATNRQFPQWALSYCDASDGVSNHGKKTTFENVIEHSDLIFGCCGHDIFVDKTSYVEAILRGDFGDKTFVSLSSGDYEFLTLLRLGSDVGGWVQDDRCGDLFYATANGKNRICVLRGGYPVNFNNSGVSLGKDIAQLTRSLLLLAAVQASNRAQFAAGSIVQVDEMVVALDAGTQHDVVRDFLRIVDKDYQRYGQALHERFKDLAWIENNSKYNHCYHHCFHMPRTSGC